MKTPTRPLCLGLEDAENEITMAIEQASNKHGLPCYLIEPIVSRILTRLQSGKKIELENAKREYEKQLEECNDEQ
jgi:hypothetical protein